MADSRRLTVEKIDRRSSSTVFEFKGSCVVMQFENTDLKEKGLDVDAVEVGTILEITAKGGVEDWQLLGTDSHLTVLTIVTP